ncbi:hypothetical protein FACS1894219_12370 [Clostridia bacterium]|nr:hypothetical protein FACS1894219_12370 [Clostridia bacterium]
MKTNILTAVIIPDGMADTAVEALDGLTPMEKAIKPVMDFLAKNGTVGGVLNVPAGMVPESDTANLAIFGYDPAVYSKGRSPLEAMSMGLTMRDGDTAFRCNLVNLTEDGQVYADRVITDHSADEITTEEANELI